MLSKSLLFILFLLLSVLTISCNQQPNENLAGVKHFYFEFIDLANTDYTKSIVIEVSNIFPQNDYLMSEESAAKGWPFYGSIERGSSVLKSDMMPPHTNVNRLSPISKISFTKNEEHILKAVFSIKSKNDSTLSITKESFEWHEEEWITFSKKLTTDFHIKEAEKREVALKISKTLIRYTFK